LEALECKYEFVTVSELIYKDNYVIFSTICTKIRARQTSA
jgi:hypothetical protein